MKRKELKEREIKENEQEIDRLNSLKQQAKKEYEERLDHLDEQLELYNLRLDAIKKIKLK